MHLLSQVPRLEAHSMLYPRPLHRTASEPGAGQQTQHSPCCPRSIGCLANHCSETHPSVDTPLPGTPPFSFTSFILFFFFNVFILLERGRERDLLWAGSAPECPKDQAGPGRSISRIGKVVRALGRPPLSQHTSQELLWLELAFHGISALHVAALAKPQVRPSRT